MKIRSPWSSQRGLLICLLLFAVTVSSESGDASSHPLNCLGIDPCIGSRSTSDLNAVVYYWYNDTANDCQVVSQICSVNTSLAFAKLEYCLNGCGVSSPSSGTPVVIGGCNGTQFGCEGQGPDDGGPSLRQQSLTVVIAVSCLVALLAMGVLAVVTVYMVRRRRQRRHRKFLESILHQLTDENGSDTDEWEDNPEVNNLFDRLDRH